MSRIKEKTPSRRGVAELATIATQGSPDFVLKAEHIEFINLRHLLFFQLFAAFNLSHLFMSDY